MSSKLGTAQPQLVNELRILKKFDTHTRRYTDIGVYSVILQLESNSVLLSLLSKATSTATHTALNDDEEKNAHDEENEGDDIQ